MGRKTDERSQSTVTWGESPPESAQFDWAAIASEVKSRPMAWAKIADNVRISVINAARQGSISTIHPSRGFEVRTTNNTQEAPRTATLFIRWNPDKEVE